MEKGQKITLRQKRIKGRIVLWIGLVLFLFTTLFPFYWMLLTSFRPDVEIYSWPPKLLTSNFTLMHYIKLFTKSAFPIFLKNSILISSVVTLNTVVISSMGAFSIVRLRFKGSAFLSKSILFTYLIPQAILFIPLLVVVTKFNLYNTKWALIATYYTFSVPFCVWMLISYFQSIPPDMEECAMIDGCTRFQTFYKILLPMAAPGVGAAALFTFTQAWNEFLYALVFTQTLTEKTVPVGISHLMLSDVYKWGMMMAASAISSVPIVAVYFVTQRFIVGGMTAGSIKG